MNSTLSFPLMSAQWRNPALLYRPWARPPKRRGDFLLVDLSTAAVTDADFRQ